MIERLLSFWEGNFWGAMSSFAGVFGTNCVLDVGTSMILQQCHARHGLILVTSIRCICMFCWNIVAIPLPGCLVSLEEVWHCSLWESPKNQHKKSGWWVFHFMSMVLYVYICTSAIVFMPNIWVIYRHQKYSCFVQLFLSTSAEVNSVTGRPCHFDAPALAFLKPARPKVVHRSFQEI